MLTTAGNLSIDYSRNEGVWQLEPYYALLAHTGLQTLTISGANFCLFPPGPTSPRYTQLQELRLLNCGIPSQTLNQMLQYPQRLKHLTLKGQRKNDIDAPRGFNTIDRSEYIDGIKAHLLSLETLDLDLHYEWGGSIDLRDFKALKKLTIKPRMVIGDEMGNTGYAIKTVSATRWRDLLPPNLTQLTFWDTPSDREPVFPVMEIYEVARNGNLSKLSSFTCETRIEAAGWRSFCPPEEIVLERCTNARSSIYQDFSELGIHFSLVDVAEIQQLPEGKACPCECWIYKHRFPYCLL